MAQYEIGFDLDTVEMRNNGFTADDITRVYQQEIPLALSKCGFVAHQQDSIYHTETENDTLTTILQMQEMLRQHDSNFFQYVRRIHVFRMNERNNVIEFP